MMRSRSLALLVLLPFLACQRQPQQQQPTPSTAADTEVAPYKLQIVFRGLIGFAHDATKKKVWAFLMKTTYDPANPDPNDLPLHVFEESQKQKDKLGFFNDNYPRHYAMIRFPDAEVTGCDTPGTGCPIDGYDISFEVGGPHLGNVNLDKASDATLVTKANNLKPDSDLARQLASFDVLDLSLTTDLTADGLDHRLAARVAIESGDVVANYDSCLAAGKKQVFTYNGPSDKRVLDSCDADPQYAVPLAEEVTVTQENVSVAMVVKLQPNGKPITVKPKTGKNSVTIEIVNVTQHGLQDPCHPTGFHGAAFRWLYKLSKDQVHPESHYFPCLVQGSKGGDKCPVGHLIVVQGGG